MMSKEIRNEILQSSYWEHFKAAKDLALILPLNHPKRIKIENEVNKLSQSLTIPTKGVNK